MKLGDLLRDVGLGIKLTASISQRNFMERLQRIRRVTPGIRKLAETVVPGGTRSRLRYWERQILKERLRIKEREINVVRSSWKKQTQFVEKKMGGLCLRRYRDIKKRELNIVWSNEKASKMEKLGRMRIEK